MTPVPGRAPLARRRLGLLKYRLWHWVAQRPERARILAGALRALGGRATAAKLHHVEDHIAPIVWVDVPPLGRRRRRSFVMETCGGSDQTARDIWGGGWHAFERPLPDLFAACVERYGGVVLDVGANTGFYSLVAAAVSPSGHSLAFEPFSPAADVLERNLVLNGWGGCVELHRTAVSDHVGEAALYVPPADHGLVETSASLNEGFKEEMASSAVVAVTTLDAHLAAIGAPRVGVVKIDVESLEHRVLAGAPGLLGAQRPVVFLEVLPMGDAAAIERARREHGYTDLRLRPTEVILAEEVRHDPSAWNHALVPDEELAAVLGIVESLGLRWAQEPTPRA